MLSRPLLGFLALAVTSITGYAAASSSDFTLPHLFSFELQAAANLGAIVYPYGGGQRLNIALTSGIMTTPGNGTVATLVPGLGGEQGVVREDGVFLIDARVVLQVKQSFDSDRKFAFLQFRGKSLFLTDGTGDGLTFMWAIFSSKGFSEMLMYHYREFETDSPAFAYLNGYFLAGKLSRSGLTLSIDVYGVRLNYPLVTCADINSNRLIRQRSNLWQRNLPQNIPRAGCVCNYVVAARPHNGRSVIVCRIKQCHSSHNRLITQLEIRLGRSHMSGVTSLSRGTCCTRIGAGVGIKLGLQRQLFD